MNRVRFLLVFSALLLLFLPSRPGAGQTVRPTPGKFRHERIISPGGQGPNRLLIDPALLAGGDPGWHFTRQATGSEREPMVIATGGLKDLRIYDSSNREVPYLMILPPVPEAKWIAGELAPLGLTKRTSGFQVDFGRELLMDRLRLSGIPAPFVKRCVLEASGDANRWRLLRVDATVFDMPAERLQSLDITFSQGDYRYLRVTWDDSASSRIHLPRSVEARLVSAGSLPPRLEAPVRFERRQSEPGFSRYRIHLPGARLPVTGIALSAGGGNVLRQARVTEAGLSGGEMIPRVLGTSMLRREVRGDVAAAEMSIPIAQPQEAQLDLVIEDGNNPPLDVSGITAHFAHLPWIYFESEGTKPLTARYGYANLEEPRYDLEAARESASKANPVEAKWGEAQPVRVELEGPAGEEIPASGAAIELGSFKHARSISAGRPGLNVLPLDAAVLAHSRMADLRIAGTDAKQIPYLIERAEEPLSLDLPALEKTAAPGTRPFGGQNAKATRSYYRLRLPYPNLPVARLILTTSGRVFRRDMYVVIERDPQNERQEAWTESVVSASWTHADPETSAPPLTLLIPSLKTTEAMVIVEEGDNSPLPITSAKLLLPAHRLRFFRPGGEPLKLYYGREDIGTPRYDLAILAPRLVGASAEEVQLGPESGSAQETMKPMSMKLFWVILVAAVIVLLVLIARLVKKPEAQ